MAARLNPRHQQMVRDKIRASQLVNALENHVLKGKKMPASAVTAALGLLKKCVPDLQHSILSDPAGNALNFTMAVPPKETDGTLGPEPEAVRIPSSSGG